MKLVADDFPARHRGPPRRRPLSVTLLLWAVVLLSPTFCGLLIVLVLS